MRPREGEQEKVTWALLGVGSNPAFPGPEAICCLFTEPMGVGSLTRREFGVDPHCFSRGQLPFGMLSPCLPQAGPALHWKLLGGLSPDAAPERASPDSLSWQGGQLVSAPPCSRHSPSLYAALGNRVQGLHASGGKLHPNQWGFHSNGCWLPMGQSPPWGLGEPSALHSLKFVVNQLPAPSGFIHFQSRHSSPPQLLSQMLCSLAS